MKQKQFGKVFFLFLLLPLVSMALNAQTEDKIITITDPLDAAKATLYSGTYVYQGTRSSTNCGADTKTMPYYRNGSFYLYADYWNGCSFPNGYAWYIADSITSPSDGYYVYWGWDGTSGMDYPEECTWWGDSSGNTVTVSITNAASGVAPTVTTMEASLVTTTSGTMGGNIVADGGATTSRGFVYSSTDATPTIGEPGVTQITKGTGTGTYVEVVSGLTAGVTYYYQAYGYNTYGTTYGTVKGFTTPSTSPPNKYVSGITTPAAANGVYVWIGNYYGKPAWKHQTLDYWLYYSVYGTCCPTQYGWYIDDQLKNEHGAEDFLFDHVAAATCPSSGWTFPDNSAAAVVVIDYPQIDFSDGAAYSPGNPLGGTTNNPIGRFFLDADIAGASLTAATIGIAGVRAGVSNLKLWSSSDATFNSASDTQLNSQADGATVTFSGFNSSISTAGSYYFVTADLTTSASGAFAATIGSKSNMTFSGGACSTVFTNAPLSSGTITIIPTIEMNVAGNGVSIADGDTTPSPADHTDFGSADIATGSIVRTFSIENLGAGTLTLTDPSPYIVITGATTDFSLTQAPAGSIPGASSTTFQVTFNPTATGTRSAAISIANDDGDENPYSFAIQGTGTAAPEMSVKGNAVEIADGDATPSAGDHTDFGSTDLAGAAVVRTFIIENTGSAALLLTAASPHVAIAGHAGDFSVTLIPASSIASGGGTTSFNMTFDPTAPGLRSATVSIANNDGDENPYDFAIQGTGFAAPTVTTNAATGIGASAATLNGTVNANNASTAVTFEYGLTTAYGSSGSAVPGTATGTGNTAVSLALAGLIPNTTYHFRAVGVNSAGTANGSDLTFTTLAVAPTVTTNAATGVSSSAATLNATVNANNASTTVTFQYGLTTGYGSSGSAVPGTTTGTGNTAVSLALAGLVPNTTYHFRAVGVNSAGTANGSDRTFTTPAIEPTVTTNAATGIGASAATLNGTVNANNASTTVTFQYGLTTAYGTSATAVQSPVGGSAATQVSIGISGLIPNTTYHFRAVGVNTAGITTGSDRTFTTLAIAPTVTTNAATGIGASAATLNATVNANNASTAVTFEYGLTTAYGSSGSGVPGTATGTGNTAVSLGLTGLVPNTTYHFRAVGVNSAGTANGSDRTFTTLAVAPTVTTIAATGVSSSAATLNGTVNANNASTTVTFEYGLTTAYGSGGSGVPGTTTGTGNTAVSLALTGLIPNTTYHFRTVGVNSAGTANGSDLTFTTLAIAPSVTTTPASGITTTTATLNGTVNANNQSASVTFEYGLTTAYGTSATAAQSPVDGSAATLVSIGISGLFPNSIYHFRVVGQNATGTNQGSDLTFTTSPAPPTVTTEAADGVTPTGATLHGTVTANNQTSTVTFEYGLTTAYGSIVSADQSPLGGSAAASVSRTVNGLIPELTYHYRVVGQNATGTTYGNDRTFMTPHLNVAPSAWPDDYKIMENELLRVPAIGVLGNDTDPEAGPLSARLLAPCRHGRVTLRNDGSFTYAPDQNYSGTDRFVYVANDGALDSNEAEVTIIIGAVNDPPTVRITSPENNDLVKGLVAIVTEANDDQQVAAVTFSVDGVALADHENKMIDLGDIQFDVSDGISLALDGDRSLMLLTDRLQWRILAGPQAGILELCSDSSGAIRLLRQNHGAAQWLKIDPRNGQAAASADEELPCRPATPGATLELPLTSAGGTGNERIVIYNAPPRRIDLQRGEAVVQTWDLPLTRIEQFRHRGDWLAIAGSKTGGQTAICLLQIGSGTMRTLELPLQPTAWDVLANGALLSCQSQTSDSPPTWGVWQYGNMGWSFSEGEPMPRDPAMLAALPGASFHPAPRSGVTGGTYTGEWNARGAAAGPHTIEVMAVDNEGLSATDRITVNVQNIVLTLTARRISEKLWIIRHDYAEISMQVINANSAEISRYILERKNAGDWITVREIFPGDLQDDRYSCKDTEIESGKPYTYQVRAVDGSGATIATSQPVTL